MKTRRRNLGRIVLLCGLWQSCKEGIEVRIQYKLLYDLEDALLDPLDNSLSILRSRAVRSGDGS